MEEFVQSVGLDPTVLTRPPTPGETISKSYCPRCHLEYAMPEGNCDRCGGMSLLPIGAV